MKKYYRNENKLANMELEILHILPKNLKQIREEVVIKRYKTDHREIPYLISLTNLMYDLKQSKDFICTRCNSNFMNTKCTEGNLIGVYFKLCPECSKIVFPNQNP